MNTHQKFPHEMTIAEMIEEEKALVKQLESRKVKPNRFMADGIRPERAEELLPEAIVMELWREYQEKSPARNVGISTLEAILSEKPPTFLSPFSGKVDEITDRDIQVAASVIQWLGTHIGLGFMREADRRIKLARRLVQIRHHRINNLGDRTAVKGIPKYIEAAVRQPKRSTTKALQEAASNQ